MTDRWKSLPDGNRAVCGMSVRSDLPDDGTAARTGWFGRPLDVR
jgi:hypothetical protein